METTIWIVGEYDDPCSPAWGVISVFDSAGAAQAEVERGPNRFCQSYTLNQLAPPYKPPEITGEPLEVYTPPSSSILVSVNVLKDGMADMQAGVREMGRRMGQRALDAVMQGFSSQ